MGRILRQFVTRAMPKMAANRKSINIGHSYYKFGRHIRFTMQIATREPYLYSKESASLYPTNLETTAICDLFFLMRCWYNHNPAIPSKIDVTIPSFVGVKMTPFAPLSLMKPLIISGMLRPLMRLCRIKPGQTDLLASRNSPKRIAVGIKPIRANVRNTGRLVVR